MSQVETKVTLPDGTTYTQPTGILIDGIFTASADESWFESVDPYTQKPICSVARGKEIDIHRAVQSAKASLREWKKINPQQKGRFLCSLADLMERDGEILARIESIDGGKPVKIAKTADVLAAASCLRYFGGWADKIQGDTVHTDPDSLNMTLKEPYGVCGLIVPWNFPLLIACWKLGPALATGNTVVLKPAELTPLSALYLGKLIVEAGIPSGVVNIVPGFGKEAGASLTAHPDVDKISFTGSTPVGKAILAAASNSNLKKVSLELGGKSPIIVFESADLDKVVEWANGGIFYNMGQNCCAGSRIYVQESVYEEFLKKFVARAEKNIMGSPFDDETFLGPQISSDQHSKILGMIEKALQEGAICATGGKGDFGGWFIKPTVLRDVHQNMTIMKEEVFGPVVAVAPFKNKEDVLELANDTCYGLAAGIFTNRIHEALLLTREIQAGTVWINCYNAISHQLPFGGYKQSGNGKDLGEAALGEFIQTKTVRFMS